MTDGYIYCFSNLSMPGILKIGMTERTPRIRLDEANVSDTWRPPTPYTIEFAKKVSNALAKEKTLHIILEQYTYRPHPRREFFHVSPEEVRKLLDLMDGEMWAETHIEKEEEEEEEEDDTSSESEPRVKPIVKGCRDMAKCFRNGQRIRHTIGINKTWIGIYNSINNGIIYDGKTLTLNKFAVSHIRSEKPHRISSVNAWKECECEVEMGQWISTYSLHC
jgi:hypothetical protein